MLLNEIAGEATQHDHKEHSFVHMNCRIVDLEHDMNFIREQ